MSSSGGNGGKAQILGPGGQPIRKQHGLAVIKVYGKTPPPHVVAMIGKAMDCDVIIIPWDTAVLVGQVAWDEVERLHEAIHKLEDKRGINP